MTPYTDDALPYRTIGLPRSTSGFKGVSWDRCRREWTARARADSFPVFLGAFHTAEEAALAYDAFIIAFRPRGSYTNLVNAETG